MLYEGRPVGDDETRLVAPELECLVALETGETDDFGPWARWRERAPSDDTIMYFAIERHGDVVGEIFLHDIDLGARTGMVGYRIFEPRHRRRGTGTSALRHLVAWTVERQLLDRIVGIARADNSASCCLLEKAGFRRLGPAREDPARLVHELVVSEPGFEPISSLA